MMAVAGETTESIGAARIGMSKEYASIDQVTETSSGSLVRLDGTTAMSSKAYARRARLEAPISVSILTPTAYRSRLPGSAATSTEHANTQNPHEGDLVRVLGSGVYRL
jgi:hypothetical protein